MRMRTIVNVTIAAALTGATHGFPVTVAAPQEPSGAVYTMTNAASGNSVLVFEGAARGRLKPAGEFSTGGLGTGGGLGSQGAIALTSNQRFLLVVNAGSNDITSFLVNADGLEVADRVSSGGRQPISVAVDRNLVYVLNAGGSVGESDNITGFRLGSDGRLSPIPQSTRPLSAPSTGPAQVAFSPDGAHLVVTEKSASALAVYSVTKDGLATGPQAFPSSGTTPFRFSFGKHDLLVVSEAAASTVSSYSLASGSPEVVTASIPTMQTAACWLTVTDDGRFAYTANAGSGSITGYSITFEGSLTPLDSDGRTAVTGTGSHPTDLALSGNGRFLFQLSAGANRIDGFRVGTDGSLTTVSSVSGIPSTAAGLVSR